MYFHIRIFQKPGDIQKHYLPQLWFSKNAIIMIKQIWSNNIEGKEYRWQILTPEKHFLKNEYLELIVELDGNTRES